MTAIQTEAHDVVIVGGGAASLNAALVLGRARRRVAVVDAGAPRNAPASHMHGFLSRDGMPPADLLGAGRAEVTGYGVELVDDHVLAIGSGFSVRLARRQTLRARRILIATGLRDELPEIPGVRERWGRDFLHCPYCHGWEVRDDSRGAGHPASCRRACRTGAPVVRRRHLFRPHPSAHRSRTCAVRGMRDRVVDGGVAPLVVEADRRVSSSSAGR